MKKIVAAILGMAFTVFAYGAQTISPEMVINHIDSKGTQSARKAYFSCEDVNKAKGYDLVKRGSQAWLKIAARLVKDSDGCYTLGLTSAIAQAIVNNPEGVLDLVNTDFKLGADDICVPFMADETDPAVLRGQLKTLGNLERALKKITSLRLQAKKNSCLERVHSMQDAVRGELSSFEGN